MSLIGCWIRRAGEGSGLRLTREQETLYKLPQLVKVVRPAEEQIHLDLLFRTFRDRINAEDYHRDVLVQTCALPHMVGGRDHLGVGRTEADQNQVGPLQRCSDD